jgi:heme exporter protein D
MIAWLGPHAAFILSSYAAAILIIGGLAAFILADHRAARHRLSALEAEREHAYRENAR